MRAALASPLALAVSVAASCGAGAGAPHPYAAGLLERPAPFAPGVVSTAEDEGYATFEPDGRTVWFVRYEEFGGDGPTTIHVSRFEQGRWTAPAVAPFSGVYRDHMPFVAPDGSALYFISKRPVDGSVRGDWDVWRVSLPAARGGATGEPERLSAAVNSTAGEYGPSLDRAGNLWFSSDRPGGAGAGDVYRAERAGSGFAPAVRLGDVDSSGGEWGTCIAPDGETLFLECSGRPGNLSPAGDLWVSRLRDGAWTAPRHLGEPINSPASEPGPRLSPDGRYLFFGSDRDGSLDVFQVSLSAVPIDP